MREKGLGGRGGAGLSHLYRDHLFHLRKNKNTDRACRQTRAGAAEDFTGLRDVIPPYADFTTAGSRSGE